MAYRLPAENEEAKLDAAEVAAFSDQLGALRKKGMLAGAAFCATLFGVVVFMGVAFVHDIEARRAQLDYGPVHGSYTIKCSDGQPVECWAVVVP
jgi:hypothetical protein